VRATQTAARQDQNEVAFCCFATEQGLHWDMAKTCLMKIAEFSFSTRPLKGLQLLIFFKMGQHVTCSTLRLVQELLVNMILPGTLSPSRNLADTADLCNMNPDWPGGRNWLISCKIVPDNLSFMPNKHY